ncbi:MULTISPECIES: ALF repeat-containing protein [unclassified Streptomyces]|uniref:ALF repeat-containing protein n=1 Tax=unclassified Streptomyces TaxID=2593676 RepID=UPI0015A152F9|nr:MULTISPECIES: ALF repeat-containing protein [unclassified Streptomyces]
MKQGMRLVVARTVAAVGPIEKQAGRAALDADTPNTLRQFITTGDTQARTQDERVRAAQLADPGNHNTGPQLKAAARIALEGPTDLLHAFIVVGQYKTQRQDQLGATHEAQVQQLIDQAARVAATAQKNAAEACNAAATAGRRTATEAAGYAKQAQQAAKDAQKYPAQADGYATQAEQSAKYAAASASTARKAQQNAASAAAAAVTSAAHAQFSADAARSSADSAWTAAPQARSSATAAGKDATAAAQAATAAYRAAVTKQRQQDARWRQIVADRRKKPAEQEHDDDRWIPDWLADAAHTVGDYGKAIFGNPDIWAGLGETGLGVLGIGIGGTGDAAGGALCITIVGCLEGAPAIVSSTSLAGAGIFGVGDGVSRFSDGLGQALRDAQSTGRTSAGGANEQRAMDLVMENASYGNQLPRNEGPTVARFRWVGEMEQTVDGVEVHYVYNTKTREAADFKFKDRSQ